MPALDEQERAEWTTEMNCTSPTATTANSPFSLGNYSQPTAVNVAAEAAESLQIFADQLQNQIAAVGDTKAADVPLALLFSVLKSRATIRRDVAAVKEGRR